MKINASFVLLSLAASSQANWFGSSDSAPSYSSWSTDQLTSWLEANKIPVPSSASSSKYPSREDLVAAVERNWNSATAWTQDQYNAAQKTFHNVKASTFETWDESDLREFLLKQGIVAPKGPREELVILAKQQYKAYTDAASTLSAQASTAVYGDKQYQATKSASSAAAKATGTAQRTFDDTKDYVYSSWDNNQIRTWLEKQGVKVQAEAEQDRKTLLGLVKKAYAKTTNPVYETWSDSYVHDWLVSNNIISPAPPSPYSREYLLQQMQSYYYDANDRVYSTWTDSQLRSWLIDNNVIKSDAQVTREKMIKLVDDNYTNAKSTILSAWSDSQLRDWLVEHGVIDDRNVVQKKRDELLELVSQKYTATAGAAAAYLAWPDARLRSYLRLHGISESYLPTSRPGLLQEVRIRWVQTQTTWERVSAIVGGVEGEVEDRLYKIWSLMKGEGYKAKGETEKKWWQAKGWGDEKAGEAERVKDEAKGEAKRTWSDAEKQYEKAKAGAYEGAANARGKINNEL